MTHETPSLQYFWRTFESDTNVKIPGAYLVPEFGRQTKKKIVVNTSKLDPRVVVGYNLIINEDIECVYMRSVAGCMIPIKLGERIIMSDKEAKSVCAKFDVYYRTQTLLNEARTAVVAWQSNNNPHAQLAIHTALLRINEVKNIENNYAKRELYFMRRFLTEIMETYSRITAVKPNQVSNPNAN